MLEVGEQCEGRQRHTGAYTTVRGCEKETERRVKLTAPQLRTKVETMSLICSGRCKSAAPMPRVTLKGLGQPQLRSIPATSSSTTSAARNASTALDAPTYRVYAEAPGNRVGEGGRGEGGAKEYKPNNRRAESAWMQHRGCNAGISKVTPAAVRYTHVKDLMFEL